MRLGYCWLRSGYLSKHFQVLLPPKSWAQLWDHWDRTPPRQSWRTWSTRLMPMVSFDNFLIFLKFSTTCEFHSLHFKLLGFSSSLSCCLDVHVAGVHEDAYNLSISMWNLTIALSHLRPRMETVQAYFDKDKHNVLPCCGRFVEESYTLQVMHK